MRLTAFILVSVALSFVTGAEEASPMSNSVPVADNQTSVCAGACERIITEFDEFVKTFSNKVVSVCMENETVLSNEVAYLSRSYNARLETELSEIDKQIGAAVIDREFYSKRYAELEKTHGRFVNRMQFWLTVVCLVVTVLGIAIPIALVLLQRKSFERESELIKKSILFDINVITSSMESRFVSLQKDSLSGLGLTLSNSIAQFDMMLAKRNLSEETLNLAFMLSPIVFGVHQLIECAMRTGDERIVKETIGAYRKFIDRWQSSDDPTRKIIWKSVADGISKAIVKDRESMMRSDYVKVLGNNTDSLRWLEHFYEDLAGWKFV